jgi:hypothetical protein
VRKKTITETFQSAVIMATAALLCLLAACATTQHEGPSIGQRISGEGADLPKPSGFLGDYSQLTPGPDQAALLRYINPAVNWSDYNKIIIDPVTFYGVDPSKVPTADQQTLANYFFNQLTEQLGKEITIVDQPGPGVMRLSVALTDAESATPGLRTVSTIVPQARVLNAIVSLGSGSLAFVGSAQGEGQITDSVTGVRMAAFVDKRVGGSNLKNVAVFQWGDTEHVMDFWALTLAERLQALRSTGNVGS